MSQDISLGKDFSGRTPKAQTPKAKAGEISAKEVSTWGQTIRTTGENVCNPLI